MAFRGVDFLGVAERLIELTNSGEPEARTAVGRAYYAAFLHARAYVAAEIEPVENKPGSHSKVRKLIEPVSDGLARALWRLHDLRKDADYVIPFDDPTIDAGAMATLAIELARDIVTGVDRLPRTAPNANADSSSGSTA